MSISLYDVTVASYRRIIKGSIAVLAKGEAHCQEQGIDPDTLMECRLVEDMLPLHYQVTSTAHHSLGALKALESGVFTPPPGIPGLNYAGLSRVLSEAEEGMAQLTPEVVNGLADGQLVFKLGDREIPYEATNFMLSFSVPNFYFHATTLYDILRQQGVPLGKLDYLDMSL
ncbi:MAG: DUF1993 domain-containing protein [Halioglobus sp.]